MSPQAGRPRDLTGFLRALAEARDTSRVSERAARESKDEARRNWSAVPCGSDSARADRYSRLYFEEIERYRYRTQPWTAEAIDGFDLEGKRVLEVGFGAGTDHLRLARRAHRIFGIDVTWQSIVETSRRFEAFGQRPRLGVADMEFLPFRDGCFDLVYSFGVVHHGPDPRQTVREMARVLAPGGKAYVAVYHKHSLYFWWSVYLFRFVLKGGWRQRDLRAQLSLIERPNTNEKIIVLLHRRREFADLFRSAGFANVRSYVRHLVPGDIAGLDVLCTEPERPRPALDVVGRFLGWYVVVEATKGSVPGSGAEMGIGEGRR